MIQLGDKVQDTVTGFKGIATAKVEYINGCVQYCVKPKVGRDNKQMEGEYIDIQQLKKISGGMQTKPKKTGGPQKDCPKY